MKNSWCIAFLFGCAGAAVAADDTVRLLPAPLEMPRRIGPLVYDGAPHRFEQRELGVAYQYLGRSLSLTIYVYDLGIENIPDGGDTNVSCEQFEQAKFDVVRAGYANTVLKSQQLVRLASSDDAPLAREALLEFEREGHPTISYLWVTGVAKNFVKLRFSLDSQLRDEAVDARQAVLTALGEAIKPHLQKVVDAGEKSVSATAINLTSDAGDDMATGLMYLMLLSAEIDKSPTAGPLCGGVFDPPFDTELAVYKSLFSPEGLGDGNTKLGKKIASAAEAGFLEEFVWRELHRDSWGDSPPEGLDLAGYTPWKKKNLKRFRMPSFGNVVVGHPRPMPVDVAAP